MQTETTIEQSKGVSTMKITSNAFSEGNPIDTKYTCDGENISPQLSWSNAPDTTKSFALICDDPDAPVGVWVHWVLYNLPANTKELPQAVATTEQVLDNAKQGINDFKKIGYGGPCPPKGNPHRYYFKLYALDTELNLASGLTKEKLLAAMKGHILAECSLMGTYARKR
jgi:Raf kinase inhibitor-like YbhB/YbcL family protein